MASQRSFENFDDFFAYYVAEHREPLNRAFHAAGTGLGISIIVAAFWIGKPWLALLWIPAAYGLSWTGHFLVEGNKPATFRHPWWSLVSDFRMLGLMLSGRLEPWLERVRADDKGRVLAASAGQK